MRFRIEYKVLNTNGRMFGDQMLVFTCQYHPKKEVFGERDQTYWRKREIDRMKEIFGVKPASSRFRKNRFDPRCFGGVRYKIERTMSSVKCRRPILANQSNI